MMKREKIKLEPNVPMMLTLRRFAVGKEMPDRGYGRSMLYTTADDRALFVDFGTSLKISNLHLEAGESFMIMKQIKRGESPCHVVWLSPETEKMRAAKEMAQPPSELEEKLSDSLANIAEGKPAAAPRPSPVPAQIARRLDSHPEQQQLGTGTNGPVAVPRPITSANQPVGFLNGLRGDTKALVDVFAACLEHANQFGNRVKPEDVRSLLQTVYINRRKGGYQAA